MARGDGRHIIRDTQRRLVAVALALSTIVPAAASDLRVARVIGNARCDGAPLVNPANDARDMAQGLRDMGFQVLEARGATKPQMETALASARDTAAGGPADGLVRELVSRTREP